MLYVRPFNGGDANFFYRWYHDRKLAPYFRGFTGGASLMDCARAPDLMRAHILVGIDVGKKCPIGAATFADTDSVLRTYKLGLFIDSEQQNCGYAKDLLWQSLKWAFHTMNAHKVVAETLTSDDRLNLGMERANFVLEGTMRESCFVDGRFQDEHVFAMLRSEFEILNQEVEDVQQHASSETTGTGS